MVLASNLKCVLIWSSNLMISTNEGMQFKRYNLNFCSYWCIRAAGDSVFTGAFVLPHIYQQLDRMSWKRLESPLNKRTLINTNIYWFKNKIRSYFTTNEWQNPK